MKKLLFFICFGVASIVNQLSAQCLMYPVLLSQRVPQSSLIVEGKVINQKSFWNTAHNHIYTSSLVEVYKTFKSTSSPYIEVISEGGIVGDEMHKVEPSLELEIGDVGVFTLIPNAEMAQFGKPVYETYAVAQGFIKYDLANDMATEPFNKYENASVTLYATIEQFTGVTHSIVKPINAFQQATTVINSVQAVAAITGFTPTTITAGTYSILTVNGSGFGTSGTIEFKNADDGGATTVQPLASEIISWTASQIQVKVPTGAGTGVIRVNGVNSTQTLTIPYSHLNVTSSGNIAYTTKHINKSAGGYVWTYNTAFNSNAPAKASFERSLGSWRCATYINWTLSGTTSSVSAAASGDGVNIVTFNGSLGAGVLGNCYSYWGGCGSDPSMGWYVTELDIQFSNTPGGLSWQFGPAAPTGSQYDFESVTVHELGHGHQLGHVINSSDLMHYALSNGQSKRALNADDLSGGLAVMTRNAGAAVCAKTNMTPLNSSNCALGAPTASFTSNKTSVCPGQTVAFADASSGNPTSWSWTFAGGTPSTSAVQNPTITYNTGGTYSVALTATNTNGSSTYSVVGYITVSLPTTLPLTQDFQTGVFPPTNWSVVDAGADAVKWQLSTSAGQASTQSALFDNFTTNVTGTRDEIKTFVNLTGFTSSKMTFYRAYGQTFLAPNIDTLEVRVSTNCGTSSTQVYIRGGSQIATGNGDGVTLFVPTAAEWDQDTVDLTPYVGNPSVMVSIINRSNYGDGMYIDNINITGTSTAAPTATINSVSTACTGQSIALTNTTTGAPTSYSWTMTGGTPTSATTQTTSVSYATAGVKTVSLTVANATGTVTVSKTITITATPVVTVTPTSTTSCAGQTHTLTASGATTYTWLPSGSGASNVVSPTSTTVYTVTGTTSGCVSTPKTATINVTAVPVVTVTPTSTTSCAGQTRTLTASGATTYTWLPSGSGASNVVSPTSTTVYTVTGTTSGCVSTPKTATINVTAVPVVTVTPTSTTSCAGQTHTLTASGATTYTWLPSGSGASNVVSPTSTTVYTVTGTTSGCVSTPKTATINVTAIPVVTLSPISSTICSSQTTTLTASGATTYTWLPTGSGTSSAVTPTATTVYTVTGTTSGCVSTPKTATVNVTSVPVITVTPTSTTICSGKSTTLNASGATTYTWLPTGSGASNVVSPTGTTVYTVTGSIGSCNSTSKNATVTVIASPTLTASSNNTIICTGSTATITATGNATSYTWSPAGSLSSSTGSVVAASPTVTTTYTVTGTLGSCTAATSVTQNVSLCTGIANIVSSDEANVFPNPSNGVFTLAYGTTIDEVNVTIINALGQTVKTETAKNINQLSVDLTKMSKGVYYLKASTKDGSKLFKLILE